MHIEKFMFLVPNTSWFGKRQWMWFTQAIPILVPILKQYGVMLEILEANIDELTLEETGARIKQFNPDIVGIPNLSVEYWRQAHYAAKLVKDINPNIITIMGGAHPSSLPYKVMTDKNIDYIIMAEGEERLPRFLDILQSDKEFSKMDGIGYRKNGKVVINQPTSWIEYLDSLPLPDYSMFDWHKVMTTEQKNTVGLGFRESPVGMIMTSRGCPYRCSFCAKSMGNKIRLRSAGSVIKELDMLINEYGVKEIIFIDDEMYVNKKRAIEIIEGLAKYNISWKNIHQAAWNLDLELLKLMKNTGCYQVVISPESGNERVLKKIIHKPGSKEHIRNVVKWCKELDLEINTHYVFGFPGETWEEIRDTCNFAAELDADETKFAIATPFPGTELFRKAVEGGYLSEDFEWYRDDWFGFAQGLIETEEFTLPELQMLRCFEWDRINFRTAEKRAKYARMTMLTDDELEEFRKQTRRKVGIYYDQ